MKASDLIAQKLSKYTDYVFSGQGGSVVHILDSLNKTKGIKIIPSQNEQGASLAADAYSRTSGKLGIVVTTSGPGTINALQGLACSYYDSIPALYISGAPVRGALKKNKNLRQLGFQEMEIQNIVSSFTKYSTRIIDVKKIYYEIDKCIFLAKNGRPGPCMIDLPDDIQRMETNEKEQELFKPQANKLFLDSNKVEQVSKMIEISKRPVFIIGNGVKIKGEILDADEVQIDGQADVTVNTTNLLVGGTGDLKGNITSDNLDVWGKLEGEITVNGTLTIQEQGLVSGNIDYQELQIKLGGKIRGEVKSLDKIKKISDAKVSSLQTTTEEQEVNKI